MAVCSMVSVCDQRVAAFAASASVMHHAEEIDSAHHLCLCYRVAMCCIVSMCLLELLRVSERPSGMWANPHVYDASSHSVHVHTRMIKKLALCNGPSSTLISV